MKISNTGLELIKRYEGLKLEPYKDIGGVCTIGYGHTENVTMDMGSITVQQADDFLIQDAYDVSSELLQYCYPFVPNQNQFDALCSLCYNVGFAPMRGTLGTLLRQNNVKDAAQQFDAWVHDNGKVIVGLQLRRHSEKALFLTPVVVASDIQNV